MPAALYPSNERLANSVETEFRKGYFVMRQKVGKVNGVWTDMALEEMYNPDAKTKLFSGILQNQSTANKYLKALPALTSISQQTLEIAHMISDKAITGMISPAKDRNVDPRIVSALEKKIHPFQSDVGDDLVNICTGQVAPSTDLVAAKEKRLEVLKFAEENNASKIGTIKLKTFMDKAKCTTATPKLKKLQDDERSISRSLCFASN